MPPPSGNTVKLSATARISMWWPSIERKIRSASRFCHCASDVMCSCGLRVDQVREADAHLDAGELPGHLHGAEVELRDEPDA